MRNRLGLDNGSTNPLYAHVYMQPPTVSFDTYTYKHHMYVIPTHLEHLKQLLGRVHAPHGRNTSKYFEFSRNLALRATGGPPCARVALRADRPRAGIASTHYSNKLGHLSSPHGSFYLLNSCYTPFHTKFQLMGGGKRTGVGAR